MSYGLEIFDPVGVLNFSTSDITWNYLGSYEAPNNTSIVFTGIGIMPERIVVRVMLDQINGDDESFTHTYTLVGDTLTATAPVGVTQRTLLSVFGR